MTSTVVFQRSSLPARASRIRARNWAPAAGVADGCSDELVPSHDTSASTPLAQSSSKARLGTVARVGLAGSPIPPGVPSPQRVLLPRFTALYSSIGMPDLVFSLANQG